MDDLSLLLAAQGIQAGAGLGNDFSQAQAYRGQQAYASQQGNWNAAWAYYRAADALKQGDLASSRIRLQGEQIEAHQRARGGASGIAGPAAIAANDTQLISDFQRLDAQNEAFRRSIGAQADAVGIKLRNRMDRLATRAKINNTYIQAASSTASAALGAYGAYNRYSGLQTPTTPYAQQPAGGESSYTPQSMMVPAVDYGANQRSMLA